MKKLFLTTMLLLVLEEGTAIAAGPFDFFPEGIQEGPTIQKMTKIFIEKEGDFTMKIEGLEVTFKDYADKKFPHLIKMAEFSVNKRTHRIWWDLNKNYSLEICTNMCEEEPNTNEGDLKETIDIYNKR